MNDSQFLALLAAVCACIPGRSDTTIDQDVEGKIARRRVHPVNPAQVILRAELLATLPVYSAVGGRVRPQP